MTRIPQASFGREATDKITGFTGIITGHVSYITGSDQFLISPVASGNTLTEAQWFDVDRVEIDMDTPAVSLDVGINQDEARAMDTSPFDLGDIARQAGEPETANPFDPEIDEDAHTAWNDGWMSMDEIDESE